LTNTNSFGPPGRDINAPNAFGKITTTISTPRTVELVLKFFFGSLEDRGSVVRLQAGCIG
jgi:hypothetical protein